MTLFEIINNLKEIALTQPNVRTALEGNIYESLNANSSIKYSVFFITQGQHSMDDEYNYYQFILFYVDRLVDDMESNRLQIQSVAMDALSNIVRTFMDDYECSITNITFNTFTQRFADECGGAYCTVTFKLPLDYICGEDY